MPSVTSTATKVNPLTARPVKAELHPRTLNPNPIRPNCLVDHHAPKSVYVLFEKWVREADKTGNGVIKINRQVQPYSDTAVDRAIKWLLSHRLLMLVERGPGRSNGSRFLIRWSFAHPALSHRQRAVNHPESIKTVNFTCNTRIKGVLEEGLKQEPPRPSTGTVLQLNDNDQKQKLTAWLAQADVDRPPTDQERRKLSVAVRRMTPPILADPLLGGLWWRVSAPLRLWRDVVGAIWSGVSVFDASNEELTWAVRCGLKRLNEDGNRVAFLSILENGPVEEEKDRIRRRLTGLRQWRIAQGEDCTGEALSWYVETRRSLEKEQEALLWT